MSTISMTFVQEHRVICCLGDLPIPFVAFLKLTASSRPSAPPSDSPKCLRFGHWLTLCTLNIRLLTYLLTFLTPRTQQTKWTEMKCNTSMQFNSVPFVRFPLCNATGQSEPAFQFSSVQFSSVQFSSVQFSSVQFCSVLFSSVQFCSVQFCSVQPHLNTVHSDRTELNCDFSLNRPKVATICKPQFTVIHFNKKCIYTVSQRKTSPFLFSWYLCQMSSDFANFLAETYVEEIEINTANHITFYVCTVPCKI